MYRCGRQAMDLQTVANAKSRYEIVSGRTRLTRIMHGAACFWTLVDEAHAFNPTGWIGESNSRCDALLVDLW
jgi:hypothetical protein